MNKPTVSCVSCLAIFVFVGFAVAQQERSPTAGEIVNRVTEVYGSCRSYVDEGQSLDEFRPGIGTSKSWVTVFVRPSSFRFEEATTFGRSLFGRSGYQLRVVAWKEGAQEKLWPPAERLSTDETLAGGSSFVASFSHRTTERVVLSLLRPDLFRGNNLLGALTKME